MPPPKRGPERRERGLVSVVQRSMSDSHFSGYECCHSTRWESREERDLCPMHVYTWDPICSSCWQDGGPHCSQNITVAVTVQQPNPKFKNMIWVTVCLDTGLTADLNHVLIGDIFYKTHREASHPAGNFNKATRPGGFRHCFPQAL